MSEPYEETMFDILFTGDTFVSSKDLGGNPFSNSVVKFFSRSRNNCVNLETTVGNDGVKVAKAYNFQTPPDTLHYLTDNNILICSRPRFSQN